MKPVKLKIKGLNSFIEEQVVDFEKLTSRGMFGIFGPTGSGKSTILDGITLALYGEISRKSSDFVNTNCSKCNISFEFQISGKEIKRYKVIREYKRDKKSNKVLSSKCRLSDVTSEEIILCDKVREVNEKCKEIIGLSIDDFTRTVVLPQGKFGEFLKLEGKSRREMLERLFNLEKYGDNLSAKLFKRIASVKNEKNILEGQMKGYEEYTKERLDNSLKKLEKISEEYNLIDNEYKKLQIKESEVNLLWNNKKELEKYEKQLQNLIQREEEMEIKKNLLLKGESAQKIYPFIQEKNSNLDKINNITRILLDLDNKIKELSKKKKEVTEKWIQYKDKNQCEVPVLKIKEENIKDGLLDLEQVYNLYLEINELNNHKKNLKDKTNKLKESLKDVNIKIQKSLEEESKLDLYIEELKIDSIIKENIQKGMILNSKYNTLKKQYNNLKEKSMNLIKNKKQNENTLENFKEKHKLLESDYNNILKELKALSEQKILSDDELFSIQKEIINNEEQLKEKCKLINQLKEHESIMENENRITSNVSNNLCYLKEEDRSVSKKIESMQEEYYASFLRNNLKDNIPCPVCGSIHHLKSYDNILVNERELNELKNKKEQLSKDILDNEIKLKVSKAKIQEKELAAHKLQQELNKFHNSINEDEINCKKKRLENEINICNEYKNNKEKLEFKEKTIKEKYVLIKNNIDNLENNIVDINKNINISHEEISELEKVMEEVLSNINTIKEELDISDLEVKNKEIKEAEEKRNCFIKSSKEIKEVIDKLRNDKDELSNEINVLEKRIENGVTIIGEKEKNINNKMLNLQNKFNISLKDNSDYNIKEIKIELNNLLSSTTEQINLLVSTYNKLDNEKEHLAQSLEELSNKNIYNKSTLAEIEKRNIIILDRIKLLLNQENFKEEKDVINNLINEDEVLNLKSEIELFNKNIIEVTSAISRIKEKLNNKDITKEQYDEFTMTLENKKSELNNKNEERIKCSEEYKLVNEKIKELGSLSDKMDEYIHKLSILSELEKLFKGKKFIEYIAISRLKYISKDASRRLYNITNGNYGLEIDDNGKFFISDYKNGGVSRDTSTLSGGETFLASLSLALSFSSEIQLKGTAPLELFFLDEGFGTLDEDLLEVVMSSLERIHNNKLKIGIISHVESIKNRVPVKLNVNKACAGLSGSKLSIEYS